MKPTTGTGFQRRVTRVVWSIMGLAAIGYLPTLWLKDPRPSMILAAMAVIPFAATAATLPRGLGRGAGLGLVAGLSIAMAVQHLAIQQAGPQLNPAALQQSAWSCTLGTALLCAGVGLVFAVLARRRRMLIDRQWDQQRHRRGRR
jgi:hypothetical protein